jgi:rubrerythrin
MNVDELIAWVEDSEEVELYLKNLNTPNPVKEINFDDLVFKGFSKEEIELVKSHRYELNRRFRNKECKHCGKNWKGNLNTKYCPFCGENITLPVREKKVVSSSCGLNWMNLL